MADYKIMLILTNKEKLTVIYQNKTLFKHDDATNPRRRERAT